MSAKDTSWCSERMRGTAGICIVEGQKLYRGNHYEARTIENMTLLCSYEPPVSLKTGKYLIETCRLKANFNFEQTVSAVAAATAEIVKSEVLVCVCVCT